MGINQCCEFMAFWYWSGFGYADPYLWRIRILLLTFKTPTQNYFLKESFSAYYFLKVHSHHFPKIKSQKEVTKQYLGIKVFLTIFAWWQKDPDPDPLTSGSGSRRPKSFGSDGSGSRRRKSYGSDGSGTATLVPTCSPWRERCSGRAWTRQPANSSPPGCCTRLTATNSLRLIWTSLDSYRV